MFKKLLVLFLAACMSLSTTALVFASDPVEEFIFADEADEDTPDTTYALDSVILECTSYKYTGEAIEPVPVVTGTAAGDDPSSDPDTLIVPETDLERITLAEGTDYTVFYENNTDVGTATMTICGIGNYTGTLTETFRITPRSVKEADVTVRDVTYTGKARRPKVTVTYNGITLTAGTDYTVKYRNNVDVGTADAVIIGNGNFKGKARTTFEILEPFRLRKLTLSRKSVRLAQGRQYALFVSFRPSDIMDRTVTWMSSDESIAVVDAEGVVTGVARGKATITATCQGKSAVCSVRVNMPGALTIIDDDGRLFFLDKFLPIIEEKGISISTAVTPDRIENLPYKYMSWEQLEECEAKGAEVLCHTLKHRSSAETNEMSYEDILSEYAEARAIFEEKGFDGNILIYSGATGKIEKARQAASEVFDLGIAAGGSRINTDDTDPFYYMRYSPLQYIHDNPDQIYRWVDKVNQEGGWMIWIFHSYNKNLDDEALNNLRDIIDYTQESGVQIISCREGVDLMEPSCY